MKEFPGHFVLLGLSMALMTDRGEAVSCSIFPLPLPLHSCAQTAPWLPRTTHQCSPLAGSDCPSHALDFAHPNPPLLIPIALGFPVHWDTVMLNSEELTVRDEFRKKTNLVC